ncbi:hypothetical protein Tco_0740226 [Tanacetum coccineum]|uniref:Uncharacterized protein n=1 Tax=Tanacetum coccineum TaxID=301880 RepID=A0ABQ4ZHT2_9ASTR
MPKICIALFVRPTTARADLYGFADMLDAAPGRQTTRELSQPAWAHVDGNACNRDTISARAITSELIRSVAQQSEITDCRQQDRRRQREYRSAETLIVDIPQATKRMPVAVLRTVVMTVASCTTIKQVASRGASEDNKGVVKKEEVMPKFPSVKFDSPKYSSSVHEIDNKGIHVDPANRIRFKIGHLPKNQL